MRTGEQPKDRPQRRDKCPPVLTTSNTCPQRGAGGESRGPVLAAELLCKVLLPIRPPCTLSPCTSGSSWGPSPVGFLPGGQHSPEGDHHLTGELTEAPFKIKKHLPGSPLLFFPARSEFCSSRSHRLLWAHHKLLRTVSGPSLSLWKVPAVSLAVSANRSIPSHVAFLSWPQVFLPAEQAWALTSKVKPDEICPPCHSSSVIL